MFGAYKTRKIFRIGAASYEHAAYVNRVKGFDMVKYLRARRQISDPTNRVFREQTMRNKRFVRQNFLKRKAAYLAPYRVQPMESFEE